MCKQHLNITFVEISLLVRKMILLYSMGRLQIILTWVTVITIILFLFYIIKFKRQTG